MANKATLPPTAGDFLTPDQQEAIFLPREGVLLSAAGAKARHLESQCRRSRTTKPVHVP